jgi:hypothetical protein
MPSWAQFNLSPGYVCPMQLTPCPWTPSLNPLWEESVVSLACPVLCLHRPLNHILPIIQSGLSGTLDCVSPNSKGKYQTVLEIVSLELCSLENRGKYPTCLLLLSGNYLQRNLLPVFQCINVPHQPLLKVKDKWKPKVISQNWFIDNSV